MRARTWPYQVPNGGSLGELGSEVLSLNANPIFAWLTSSPWPDWCAKATSHRKLAVATLTRYGPTPAGYRPLAPKAFGPAFIAWRLLIGPPATLRFQVRPSRINIANHWTGRSRPVQQHLLHGLRS
jgi:hypothetical protein